MYSVKSIYIAYTILSYFQKWVSEWVIMEFNVAAGIFHPFATSPKMSLVIL